MAEIFSYNLDEDVIENKEGITITWFCPILENPEEIKQTIEDFQTITDRVSSFNETNKCVDFIKSSSREKIFLITSADNAYKLLPDILHLSQLNSVYIFPENRHSCHRIVDSFHKIVDIFDNLNELKLSIKRSIKHLNKQLQLLSFYDLNQQSFCDISTQSAEFLWLQIFKDVIICLPHNAKAKEDMLRTCRQCYTGNYQMLKVIDDFDKNYHPDNCIDWYTKETFVYRLLNKALRTGDVEQLYMFRFYITDLSKKLAEEHEKMKNQPEKILTFYRGTGITKTEAEKIRKNEGKYIATNCYWSTSYDKSYAVTFAKKCTYHPDMVPVLFEIKCHLNEENDSIIFADISHFSSFLEEREVLFDLGTIFTIEDIKEEIIDDVQLLMINIKTGGKGREISQQYLEHNKKEIEFESPTILLCNLLKRMGKPQESLNLLQYLLKNPGDEKLVHIHNRIGIAFKDNGLYHLASHHFEKALQSINFFDSSQRRYLPVVLLNQGLLYARIGQLEQALQLYGRAEEFLKHEFYPDPYVLAHLYSSIGRVYCRQGNFNEALHYYMMGSLIREQILPSYHAHHAMGYTDIANIYSCQNNNIQALNYHLQALDCRKKIYPANHHSIAWSLHKIAKVYLQMNEIQFALEYCLQSLQIKRQCQADYLSIPTIQLLDDIISIYDNNPDLNLSLEYHLEALNIQRKIKPINYFFVAKRLDIIAHTYKSIDKLNDSLKHYEEALDIRQKYLINYTYNLCVTFHNVATIYDRMGKKIDALRFYEKEMSILRDMYPYDHWLCQRAQRNLEQIRRSIE